MCCTSYVTAFETFQHTTPTPETSNSHNFVHIYANQVKQSTLKIPKKIISMKKKFALSVTIKCMKDVTKAYTKPSKPNITPFCKTNIIHAV